MAVTDGKLQFEDEDANQIEVTVPRFGYQTVIDLPFEIVQLDDGLFDIYDYGGGNPALYDKRRCNCKFYLNATEQQTFNNFFRDDDENPKGRAYDVTLRMNTDSGFFPFGPDKGDVGDFDVAVTFGNTPAIGEAPFLYFDSNINIQHTGSYPAYSLPSEVSEGGLTIGTITNNRFPPGWFKPSGRYGFFETVTEDGTVEWMDRSENADWYTTTFEMVSNESKAAAVIEYLTATARNNQFTLTAPTNSYPFGRDLGVSVVVKMIQSKIEITHEYFDRFRYTLKLSVLVGVAP